MPSTVRFQLLDIVHPCPVEVLWQLYGSTRLQGEVVALTSDGRQPANFLIVKVEGLSEPVLVPVEKASTQTQAEELDLLDGYTSPVPASAAFRSLFPS